MNKANFSIAANTWCTGGAAPGRGPKLALAGFYILTDPSFSKVCLQEVFVFYMVVLWFYFSKGS